MTEEEMKNKISMALKDPILQQGFEIIYKENAELKKKCEDLEIENAQLDNDNLITQDVFKENAELKEQNKKLLESCEGATMMYEDLCKAKELLKQWLQANICDSVVLFSDTEQFLNEIE